MHTPPDITGRWRYPIRRKQAAHMRALAPGIARAVTDEFFKRHPSWLEKYGLPGVERGVEDARFHIEFLAGALESGRAEAFAEYLAWAARVLSTRHIRPQYLVENVEQVRDALVAQLEPATGDVVRAIVQYALDVFDPATIHEGEAVNAGAGVYLAAALSGQRTAALNIAREALAEGASVIDVYCDVLQPAQIEIGRLWENNKITVAQEHMATAITQFIVGQLYRDERMFESKRGSVVVTGVEGEQHQLGAHMLADALSADGWDVRFLGSQLPTKDVLAFVGDHRPDVIALSVTMLFNIQKAARLIEDVKREHEGAIRVVVGGNAFRGQPELWREIGADGSAQDLRTGLELFRRLVN